MVSDNQKPEASSRWVWPRTSSPSQDYKGLPDLKNALAQYMSETRGNIVDLDPENLVLTAGATAANESLVFCIAEKGDAFLLPTPYYPAFNRDVKWRTKAEIVPIRCHSDNGFKITESALEQSYNLAKQRRLRVMVRTHPTFRGGKHTKRRVCL